MARIWDGYGIAVVVTHVIDIIVVLACIGLYKWHREYRASRDRMTRWGPYAYLVALLAALIQFIMTIAYTAWLEAPSTSSLLTYLRTFLSLAVVWDFAMGISGLLALVVIGSFVQDWTAGRKRKTEDVLIRVMAWLLFVCTLVNLGFDITIAVIDSRQTYSTNYYYDNDYGVNYYFPSGNNGLRACVYIAYWSIAILYLIWIAVLAVKNHASFAASTAYRALVLSSVSLALIIAVLNLAVYTVHISPLSYRRSRYTYARYYTYIVPEAENFMAVEPIVVDMLYSLLLLLFAFVSKTGAAAGKHVDAVETVPQQHMEQTTV